MSNHTSLPKLDIPEMKSNLTDIDDTSQSLNWKDDVPDDFANELKPPSPNKYKKKLPPEAFTKKNKQVNLPVTKEADLKAASDEVYRAEEEARALENRDENEMVDIDNPLMEELSPMMEDDEISHPASNFGDEAVDSGGTRTAFDELGANFGNDSDSGSEYNASACENVLEIDPMCTSKPMASDFADSPASDNTSDVANNMMESTTESNTESSQSREPYTHEDCRGCISKSQEVASRDKRIAELELQIATFTNKATSYTNAYTNTETLANKVVSYTEACTNTEMLANKAVSYTDASTNTETRPEQNRQPSYPREGDTERQVSTSNSLLLSSLPLPLATSLPTQVTAARFIYDCLDLVKMLYLVLTDLVSIKLQLGQELFLSYMCGSIPLGEKVFMFKDLVKATFLYMATPFCFAMNLALLLDMHQEKETWMQANSLTRKHLLKHASGESSLWEPLATLVTLAIAY